uniref:Uncharacterized protein n=1 Tax=Triticum urartu TaxID=4572 RepID=A0A8R7QFB2_TRIUA
MDLDNESRNGDGHVNDHVDLADGYPLQVFYSTISGCRKHRPRAPPCTVKHCRPHQVARQHADRRHHRHDSSHGDA